MTQERINALGFVEVRGLAAAIETADAMLKCADVRLLRQLLRDPVQTTLTVEGSLGACRAAVDAGEAMAVSLGAFVSSSVMGRPADDTADFVLKLFEAGRAPFGVMAVDGKTAMVPSSRDKTQKSSSPRRTRPQEVQSPGSSSSALLDSGVRRNDESVRQDDAEAKLLAALAALPRGIGAQALAKEVGGDADAVRQQLEALCARGTLVKRRGRYLLAKPDGEKK
ncbi:MAG: BMC domain-containing protein [Propionivibrio sp.]